MEMQVRGTQAAHVCETHRALRCLTTVPTRPHMQGKKLAAVEAAHRREQESFGNKRQQLAADVQQVGGSHSFNSSSSRPALSCAGDRQIA